MSAWRCGLCPAHGTAFNSHHARALWQKHYDTTHGEDW